MTQSRQELSQLPRLQIPGRTKTALRLLSPDYDDAAWFDRFADIIERDAIHHI